MMARTDRDDLISLLQDWSYAAARMTRGLEVSATGAVGGSPEAPPDDTGEALGLGASGLTITFGFGPTLFEIDGVDRYGIAERRPAVLERLPAFLGDDLDPDESGGDLCIQACADDPQVAVHAIRNLSRIAFGRAKIRWSQMGFGRTSRTTSAQQTPRNLFGFKDGTANILAGDSEALDEHVWVAGIRLTRLDGRRLVPRRAQDRDADRDVGPRATVRAERDHRPEQGRRRAAVGRRRVHRARTSPRRMPTGAALMPAVEPRAPRAPRDERRRRGSSAAATTSSTATTISAASTPGCSSCRTSARRSSS